MDTYEIDGNQFYKHTVEVDDTDYTLLEAVTDIYDYLVVNEGSTADDDYINTLEPALASAMLAETDLLATQTQYTSMETMLSSLKDLDELSDDRRYQGLYYLFSFLVKLDDLTVLARRVTILNIDQDFNTYTKTLLESKNNNISYYDEDYGNTYSITSLQQIILSVDSTTVPQEFLRTYMLALDSDLEIELATKNTLFNLQSFANSELRLHILSPDSSDISDITSNFDYLTEASQYFYNETSDYVTFGNYIDFDTLSSQINDILTGLKYMADAIDILPVSDSASSYAFYPSGKTELYAENNLYRTAAVDVNLSYNFAKIYYEQSLITESVTTLSEGMDTIESNQLTEDSLISSLVSKYSITEDGANEILYSGQGTDTQNTYIAGLLESSQSVYSDATDLLDEVEDLSDKMKATSSMYNALNQYYSEASIDFDTHSTNIVSTNSSISDIVTSTISTISSFESDVMTSYELTLNLDVSIDFAVLETISSTISTMNKSITSSLCLIKSMLCMVAFVESVVDNITETISDTIDFDMTDYSFTTLTDSVEDLVIAEAREQLLSQTDSILSDLSEDLEDWELNALQNTYESYVNNLNSSSINSSIYSIYTEALETVKESLSETSSCKYSPGKFELDIDLTLNLNSLKSNVPTELKFILGDCSR